MNDLLDAFKGFVSATRGSSWAIPIVLISAGLPVLHAVSGKRIKWIGAQRVLTGYVLLFLASVLSLLVLGIALSKIDPETFEAWRSPLGGAGSDPASLLVNLTLALPLAFGVSSLGYSALEGWGGIGLALLGLVGAYAFGVIAVIALLWVACAGWSSCI